MNPQIASLHERMAKGGDWRAIRDEIASLHEKATTEQEYVTLLEAHRKLVAVGQFAFDEETYAKLLPITKAEYRLFLNKEAMENGLMNPALLERITRREVEAGRLSDDDELRQFTVAGVSVLGDSKELTAHLKKKDLALAVLIGLLPDAGLAWAISHLTGEDQIVFWQAFVLLLGLQFLFGVKNALASWLAFRLFVRRKLSESVFSHLLEYKFPPPGEEDLKTYLWRVATDTNLEGSLGAMSARLLGEYEARTAQGFLASLQISTSYQDALTRYATSSNHQAST